MEILEKINENNTLRIIVGSNEESLFSLLKVYLQEESEVEVVGVHKEHHLTNKVEFVIKTKKTDPQVLLKKALKKVKKELAAQKVK